MSADKDAHTACPDGCVDALANTDKGLIMMLLFFLLHELGH